MNIVIKRNWAHVGKCELRAKRELKYSQSCPLLPLPLGFMIISCCSSILNKLNNRLTKCRAINCSNYLYEMLFIQPKDLGMVLHLIKSLWSFPSSHLLNSISAELNQLTCWGSGHVPLTPSVPEPKTPSSSAKPVPKKESRTKPSHRHADAFIVSSTRNVGLICILKNSAIYG